MKETTTSPEVNKKKKRKEWVIVLSRGKQVIKGRVHIAGEKARRSLLNVQEKITGIPSETDCPSM
jgi:hypothetical protein